MIEKRNIMMVNSSQQDDKQAAYVQAELDIFFGEFSVHFLFKA